MAAKVRILVSGATTTVEKACPLDVGILVTPHSNKPHTAAETGRVWAADNAAFSNWCPDAFRQMVEHISFCDLTDFLWCAVPDCVGDAVETRRLFAQWMPQLINRGVPMAFVLQDGLQPEDIPWKRIVAVFIGGSDAFKSSPEVADAVGLAHRRGKMVHMGRVNTASRFALACELNCHTVDGSGFSKFPDHIINRGVRWLRRYDTPGLFDVEADR